jgi:hypothetical protein
MCLYARNFKHLCTWNLDLSFLKEVENTNYECAKTKNPENHLFLTKKVVHCLLLHGRILPQLKICLFKT